MSCVNCNAKCALCPVYVYQPIYVEGMTEKARAKLNRKLVAEGYGNRGLDSTGARSNLPTSSLFDTKANMIEL